MIKRKAQVGQNCQDNKCQRSSRSTIKIHFAVAANEYSNVVGECFWRDYSSMNHPNLMRGRPSKGVGRGLLGGVLYKLIN